MTIQERGTMGRWNILINTTFIDGNVRYDLDPQQPDRVTLITTIYEPNGTYSNQTGDYIGEEINQYLPKNSPWRWTKSKNKNK